MVPTRMCPPSLVKMRTWVATAISMVTLGQYRVGAIDMVGLVVGKEVTGAAVAPGRVGRGMGTGTIYFTLSSWVVG